MCSRYPCLFRAVPPPSIIWLANQLVSWTQTQHPLPQARDALQAPPFIEPVDPGDPNPNPPDDLANGIDRYVIADLDQAARTIDVASFDFNLPSLTEALLRAEKRGVQVRVVLDLEEGNHRDC